MIGAPANPQVNPRAYMEQNPNAPDPQALGHPLGSLEANAVAGLPPMAHLILQLMRGQQGNMFDRPPTRMDNVMSKIVQMLRGQ